MEEDWHRQYHMVVDNPLYPSDLLQNRIYREFHRWSMTVTEIGMMKSLLMDNGQKIMDVVNLSKDLELHRASSPDYIPKHVVGYSWGLRTLANAW